MSVQLETNPFTLSRWLLHKQKMYPGAKGDFTLIMSSIALACKFISIGIRKAGIAKLYGLGGEINISGEEQKKLDVLSNEVMVNALRFSTKVRVMASEEEDTEIIIEGAEGKYVVTFDPLDGSSNIDCNISVGTIFGIWKGTQGTKEDLKQTGNDMSAAGYCLYSGSTQMVLTTGDGVSIFTLDPSIGDFVLSQEKVTIPQKGEIYSINEGNSVFWDEAIRTYIEKIKQPPSPYKLRYIGSMIADIHRTLVKGGIFLYPKDSKSPNGKLRLLYEIFPMAFIIQQAGGLSTDGYKNCLEIKPKTLHERSGFILGSPDNVNEVIQLYDQFKC